MKKFYSLKKDGANRVILPDGSQSRYFFYREFRNQDHSIDAIALDPEQVLKLEMVRTKFGVPVYIQVANRNLPASSYHNPNFGNSCATDFDVGDAELGTVDYKIVCQYLESIGAKEIGCYDYNDINGKHTHFIHMDMGGITKKFWNCTSINPDGTQKLTYIKTFIPAPLIPFPEPVRILRWVRRTYIFRMHGNDVKWLQTALNLVNKDTAVQVDGDFAGQTFDAVWAFQTSVGFTGNDLDGIAGVNTRNKLKEVLGL
jgi:hypothetical protein